MADWYNLLEEPWIEAVSKQTHKSEHIGIEGLLVNAHRYSEIYGKTPLLTYGMYRFLITLVSDMFEITDIDHINQLCEKASFNEQTIVEYCEMYSDEFFLFSDHTPFLQNHRLGYLKPSSVAKLFHHIPSGSNHVIFHPELFYEDTQAFCPELCAQGLTALSPFAIGFGASHKNPDTGKLVRYTSSINKSPPWYFIIEPKDATLFDVLLVNSCGMKLKENTGTGQVFWKRNREEMEFHRKASDVSTLEGMMWMPRQVHLHYEHKGDCTYCGHETEFPVKDIKFCQGWKVSKKFKWRDPHALYTKSSKRARTYNDVKPRVYNPAYIVLYSLVFPEAFYEGGYKLPVGLTQLRKLGLDDQGFTLKAFGIKTEVGKAAKFLEFCEESVYISGEISIKNEKRKVISEGLGRLNAIKELLTTTLYYLLTNSKRSEIQTITTEEGYRFLKIAHLPFKRFINEIRSAEDVPENKLGTFTSALLNTAESILDNYITYRSADILKEEMDQLRSFYFQSLRLLQKDPTQSKSVPESN